MLLRSFFERVLHVSYRQSSTWLLSNTYDVLVISIKELINERECAHVDTERISVSIDCVATWKACDLDIESGIRVDK